MNVKVVIHPDSRRTSGLVRAVGSPPGVVVADTLSLPYYSAVQQLAEGVLRGLGKSPLLWTRRRRSELTAAAWLAAVPGTQVLLPDSQTQSLELTRKRATWLSAAPDVDVWFLFAASSARFPTDHVRALVNALDEDWGVELVSYDDFCDRFPRGRPSTPDVAGLPRLPRYDAACFRDAVFAGLEPADAADVDALYVRTAQAIYRELRQAAGESRPDRAFKRVLKAALLATPDDEHFLLTARAAQVAFARLDVKMKVDTLLLLAGAAAYPRRGRANAEGWWRELDRYRDPDVGVIAALYLAGIPPKAMREIRMGHLTLDDDAATLHVRDAWARPKALRFAGDEARFFRCMYAIRALENAGPDDRLLVSHKGNVAEDGCKELLQTPTAEVGVSFSPVRLVTTAEDDYSVLARYGITFGDDAA